MSLSVSSTIVKSPILSTKFSILKHNSKHIYPGITLTLNRKSPTQTFLGSAYRLRSLSNISTSRMLKYMTSDELAAIIKSDKKSMKDYAVVDVRDDDFRGGNVKGCINTPSGTFFNSVDDLVEKTKDVPLLIFHCALSQERGPKAARVYAETRLLQDGGADTEHEVYVLSGGFIEFQDKFKDDPDLVENWDKRVWSVESLDVREF